VPHNFFFAAGFDQPNNVKVPVPFYLNGNPTFRTSKESARPVFFENLSERVSKEGQREKKDIQAREKGQSHVEGIERMKLRKERGGKGKGKGKGK